MLKVFTRIVPNMGDLVQREHLKNFGGIGMGSVSEFWAENLQYGGIGMGSVSEFWAENLQYLWNEARWTTVTIKH